MSNPPLSPARRAGDLLFLTGQLGMADGTIVEGGAAAETRQAILNIQAILEAHGASLSDIVKNSIFLADLGDFAAMNEVYAEMLGTPYPARSTMGVDLVLGARVEIEAIAYVPA